MIFERAEAKSHGTRRVLLYCLACVALFGSAFGLAYFISRSPASAVAASTAIAPWRGAPVYVVRGVALPVVPGSLGSAAPLPALRTTPKPPPVVQPTYTAPPVTTYPATTSQTTSATTPASPATTTPSVTKHPTSTTTTTTTTTTSTSTPKATTTRPATTQKTTTTSPPLIIVQN